MWFLCSSGCYDLKMFPFTHACLPSTFPLICHEMNQDEVLTVIRAMLLDLLTPVNVSQNKSLLFLNDPVAYTLLQQAKPN